MTLLETFSDKRRVALHVTAILVFGAISAAASSTAAEEGKHKGPLQDSKENAEQYIRELQEVTERYPILAQRIGLVSIPGYRIPSLCAGGVDAVCHQTVQNWCIQDALQNGRKPNYNDCLDQAYKGCCRPAVVAEFE